MGGSQKASNRWWQDMESRNCNSSDSSPISSHTWSLQASPQPPTEGQAKGSPRKVSLYLLRRHWDRLGDQLYKAQPAKICSAFLINGNLVSHSKEIIFLFYAVNFNHFISLQAWKPQDYPFKGRYCSSIKLQHSIFPLYFFGMALSPLKSQPYKLFVPLNIKLNEQLRLALCFLIWEMEEGAGKESFPALRFQGATKRQWLMLCLENWFSYNF